MIRQHLFHKRAPADPMFRWRGGDVSRIEGLSDGVFALTLTLLVISVDVPKSFFELWATVRELPVFLACFALLMMAWRYHYLFFRRYGLEDFPTFLLNAAYLFLILFCAYPLKFLATFLWHLALRMPGGEMFTVPDGVDWYGEAFQRSGMMVFYNLGLIGVFGVQTLLLLWAWRRRHDLELDPLECFLTRASIASHGLTCSIALCSTGVVLGWGRPDLGGLLYFTMPFAHGILGWAIGRRARSMYDRVRASEST